MGVLSKSAMNTFLTNMEDCKHTLKWDGQPMWGEDMFLQRCMDLHGVDKVSDFALTTDCICEAFRPEGEKKNKKWTPDCAVTQTPAMHPFKTPKVYFDCLKATQR